MAVRVFAGTLVGVAALPIEVEVDLLRRLPSVSIVGLPASAVRESAERVRSAIAASGLEFPRKRVVVNLAPADVRKEGTAFDLPVALGILAADGAIEPSALDDVLAVGELSLCGELRAVRGALPLALLARDLDRALILPSDSAREAAMVPGTRVLAADTLAEVVAHLSGDDDLVTPAPVRAVPADTTLDLADVRGQPVARRALEIAAAGRHHLLFLGPPGCGKTMLARRLPTILPDLAFDEALETTRVYSAANLVREPVLMTQRPFRAPHHTVSRAGLVGDRSLRPGEVSLAHNGVLFLDEATEFPRAVLDTLRQPLEEGRIRITRAAGNVEYPADILLVLAANPCPCGRRGTPQPCACTDGEVDRYARRLSGPLLDRVDLHVHLAPTPPTALLAAQPGESSATVRARVVAARQRQEARGQRVPNGRLPVSELPRLDRDSEALLHTAMVRHGMSGRATHRILRVARTIADLAGRRSVTAPDVAEALGFRPLEVTP